MFATKDDNVYNWHNAIRGMRNSWESWEDMDSFYGVDMHGNHGFIFGQNDLRLARTLSRAGGDHGKFMRQILVSVDIIAPEYWWKETDQYHFFETNSTSMMHTLGKTFINSGEFSMEDVDEDLLEGFLSLYHEAQQRWYESGKKKPSKEWRQMLQLTPNSFNYKRTFTTNYAQLQTMYFQRRNHRLEEWRMFCRWVESLPYSGLITKSEMGAGYGLSTM